MAKDDYALVVGINAYPELTDLKGPVDDAERFADWLRTTPGVEVPEKNIHRLLTKIFHPPGPTSYKDAHPTGSDFLVYLAGLLDSKNQADGGRQGRRLYLYFSGHGFQGKDLYDIAIYSATAIKRLGLYDHIGGHRYLESIRQKGWFEELVLIMDCCRDLELTKIVAEPSLPGFASAGAASKRLYCAFGASYGQKANESPLPDGTTGGVFTYLLIESLNNAPADAAGRVTARQVTDHFFNVWDQHPLTKNISRPEIPGGADEGFVWYTRVGGTVPLVDVNLVVPGATEGSSVSFLTGSPLTEEKRGIVVQGACSVRLPPGLYKVVLVETGRSKLLEVGEGGINGQLEP